jgi:5-methylcytosine-specific restriction endonuclease McrA
MTKRVAPYTHRCWPHLRLMVLRRDGWVCQVRRPGCQTTATHCDHIVPWELDPTTGGAWFDPDNLRAACAFCNVSRKRRSRQAITNEPSRAW